LGYLRLILLLPLLAPIASSTVLAKEVYQNVASQDSLVRADILARTIALTLHRMRIFDAQGARMR
jgi:hypothetical protein